MLLGVPEQVAPPQLFEGLRDLLDVAAAVDAVVQDLGHEARVKYLADQVAQSVARFDAAGHEYGGFSEGGDSEYIAMVVATEELSKASLGIGGSLITRPEILTRALVKGGTEEQKQKYLPRLVSGDLVSAIAMTEPGVGSDLQSITTTAVKDGNGYRISGAKQWISNGTIAADGTPAEVLTAERISAAWGIPLERAARL